MIAVQAIGAATAARVERAAWRGSAWRRRSSRKWIARWLAAGMVRTMIWATSGPPESDSLILKGRQDRLGGQPDDPAGEHRHDRPPEALNGREGHHADQDHADDRQPPAVDLDRREPVGQENRRADDRRPAQVVPRGEFVGDSPHLGDGLDHVVLMRLFQPGDHRRRRAGRVDQRARETADASSADP